MGGYFYKKTVCVDCLNSEEYLHASDNFDEIKAALTIKNFTQCLACESSKSPLWRKVSWDSYSWKTCNACGLIYAKDIRCSKCWMPKCNFNRFHSDDREKFGILLTVFDNDKTYKLHQGCIP